MTKEIILYILRSAGYVIQLESRIKKRLIRCKELEHDASGAEALLILVVSLEVGIVQYHFIAPVFLIQSL